MYGGKKAGAKRHRVERRPGASQAHKRHSFLLTLSNEFYHKSVLIPKSFDIATTLTYPPKAQLKTNDILQGIKKHKNSTGSCKKHKFSDEKRT